jgi:hypothetical protein
VTPGPRGPLGSAARRGRRSRQAPAVPDDGCEANRFNAAVPALSDALDPRVLRLVEQVCRAARGRVEVAVCGEAACDPQAIPVLLGLGVRELVLDLVL